MGGTSSTSLRGRRTAPPVAAAAATLVLGMSGLAAPVAHAATDCSPYSGSGYTATDVGGGICEITFAYAGGASQMGYTWTVPSGPTVFDVLLVGGGGGGAGGKYVTGANTAADKFLGGGGGGGGRVTIARVPASMLGAGSAIPIYVGGGGAGGPAGSTTTGGDSGSDSVFAASIAASGGAGGGKVNTTTPASVAGGNSGFDLSDNTTTPATTQTAQYNGGTGISYTSYAGSNGWDYPGAGGAGAGTTAATEAGGTPSTCTGATKNINVTEYSSGGSQVKAGDGGNGYLPGLGLFAGTTALYGGGGGGGSGKDSCVAKGGSGGGADGSPGGSAAASGAAGFGGGGGGGGARRNWNGDTPSTYTYVQTAGSAGGAGVVKIRLQPPTATVPAAPTSLVATPGNGSASIAFTAGADGGAAITNYKVKVGSGAWTALSPAVTTSPVTVPGLSNGTAYSIQLLAVNSVGDGAASAAVTVTPATVPDAPTSLVATPGNRSASITFTAGADGGAAITNYKYSTDNGTTWTALSPLGTTSPVTIPGLANGTAYSIRLRAVNSIGDGAASSPVTVTPVQPDNGGGDSPSGDSSGSAPTPQPSPTPSPTQVAASVTPDLGPEVPGSNPNLPAGGVPLGGSVFLVNGQPVPITVKPDAPRDATGLDVTGDGFTMRLVGRTTNDKPLGLTPDGALILEQDRTAYTEGTGFKPNSEVKLYVFSEPRFLGTVMTDAKGSFRGSVPLPLDIQAGRHTLQSNGLAPDGAVRSLSLGVQVQAPDAKTARARTARTTVYFPALSSRLDASARKSLRALVAGRGRATTMIMATGYVQPTAVTSNDRELSLQRAQTIATYLKSIGVKGAVVTRGDGVAKETGAAGRKAIVTITYRK